MRSRSQRVSSPLRVVGVGREGRGGEKNRREEKRRRDERGGETRPENTWRGERRGEAPVEAVVDAAEQLRRSLLLVRRQLLVPLPLRL